MLITQWLFDNRKECLLRMLFAAPNETFEISFIDLLETFPYYKIKFCIVWNIQKISSLFNNKDKLRCDYSCVEEYVYAGLIINRLRWNEHEHRTDKNSECAKHLNDNNNHEFK